MSESSLGWDLGIVCKDFADLYYDFSDISNVDQFSRDIGHGCINNIDIFGADYLGADNCQVQLKFNQDNVHIKGKLDFAGAKQIKLNFAKDFHVANILFAEHAKLHIAGESGILESVVGNDITLQLNKVLFKGNNKISSIAAHGITDIVILENMLAEQVSFLGFRLLQNDSFLVGEEFSLAGNHLSNTQKLHANKSLQLDLEKITNKGFIHYSKGEVRIKNVIVNHAKWLGVGTRLNMQEGEIHNQQNAQIELNEGIDISGVKLFRNIAGSVRVTGGLAKLSIERLENIDIHSAIKNNIESCQYQLTKCDQFIEVIDQMISSSMIVNAAKTVVDVGYIENENSLLLLDGETEFVNKPEIKNKGLSLKYKADYKVTSVRIFSSNSGFFGTGHGNWYCNSFSAMEDQARLFFGNQFNHWQSYQEESAGRRSYGPCWAEGKKEMIYRSYPAVVMFSDVNHINISQLANYHVGSSNALNDELGSDKKLSLVVKERLLGDFRSQQNALVPYMQAELEQVKVITLDLLRQLRNSGYEVQLRNIEQIRNIKIEYVDHLQYMLNQFNSHIHTLSQQSLPALGANDEAGNLAFNYLLGSKYMLQEVKGTAYLLQELGYESEQIITIMADPNYEQEVLKKAIFDRLGKAYIWQSIKNDADELNRLLHNAVLAKEELGLIPGIVLSEWQQQELYDAILWPVRENVNGNEIWSLRLYVTAEILAESYEGATIALKDVQLSIENDLFNSGLVEVIGKAVIKAKDMCQFGEIKGKHKQKQQAVSKVLLPTLVSAASKYVSEFTDDELQAVRFRGDDLEIILNDRVMLLPKDLYEMVEEWWLHDKKEDLAYSLARVLSKDNVEILSNAQYAEKLQSEEEYGLSIEVENILNFGQILLTGDLVIDADGKLFNAGVVYSGSNVLLKGSEIKEVLATSVASGNIYYEAEKMESYASKRTAGGQLEFNIGSGGLSFGTIHIEQVDRAESGKRYHLVERRLDEYTELNLADKIIIKSSGNCIGSGAALVATNNIDIECEKFEWNSKTSYTFNEYYQKKKKFLGSTTVNKQSSVHKTSRGAILIGEEGESEKKLRIKAKECYFAGALLPQKKVADIELECEDWHFKEHKVEVWEKTEIRKRGLMKPKINAFDILKADNPAAELARDLPVIGGIIDMTKMEGALDLQGTMKLISDVPKVIGWLQAEDSLAAMLKDMSMAMLNSLTKVTLSAGYEKTTIFSGYDYLMPSELDGKNVDINIKSGEVGGSVATTKQMTVKVEKILRLESGQEEEINRFERERMTFDISASFVSGSAGVSASLNDKETKKVKHIASKLTADEKIEIELVADAKMDIVGAIVAGKEVEIKGDGVIDIQDVLDTTRTESNNSGVSFGVSLNWQTGAVSAYGNANFGNTLKESSVVSFISGISGDNVNITAQKIGYSLGQVSGSEDLNIMAEIEHKEVLQGHDTPEKGFVISGGFTMDVGKINSKKELQDSSKQADAKKEAGWQELAGNRMEKAENTPGYSFYGSGGVWQDGKKVSFYSDEKTLAGVSELPKIKQHIAGKIERSKLQLELDKLDEKAEKAGLFEKFVVWLSDKFADQTEKEKLEKKLDDLNKKIAADKKSEATAETTAKQFDDTAAGEPDGKREYTEGESDEGNEKDPLERFNNLPLDKQEKLMAAFAACYKIDQCRESLPIPADITPSAFFLAAPAAPYIAAGVSVAMASFRACMTSGVCQRAVIAVGAIYTGKTVGDQAKDIWGNDDVDIWANYDAAKKAEDNNDIANDENNWYKNKNNEVKQSQQQKVSNTASNMPDPDDFDPEQFEPEKGKAKWEIKDPKEADKVMRHDKHGKFYRDPKQKYGNKEIWWTKDTAKHQGKYQGEFRESHYKLYIEKGKKMVRIADLDKYGNQLSKNMGKVGKKIPIKEFFGVK